MSHKKIHWNKDALNQFNKAIKYIANNSSQNAQKVRVEILTEISRLAEYAEIHPPDKFRIRNNGNYRAFELHRYRIAYYVSEFEVRILRIKHTSMEPRKY
jgi:plasmid stabilization system protein ParE